MSDDAGSGSFGWIKWILTAFTTVVVGSQVAVFAAIATRMNNIQKANEEGIATALALADRKVANMAGEMEVRTERLSRQLQEHESADNKFQLDITAQVNQLVTKQDLRNAITDLKDYISRAGS